MDRSLVILSEMSTQINDQYVYTDLYFDAHQQALIAFTGSDLLEYFHDLEASATPKRDPGDQKVSDDSNCVPEYLQAMMSRVRQYCLSNSSGGRSTWAAMLNERGYTDIQQGTLAKLLQQKSNANMFKSLSLESRERHLDGIIRWLNQRGE
ncbi:unnamed protein product, partial [Mesorhabditis spiculigera]